MEAAETGRRKRRPKWPFSFWPGAPEALDAGYFLYEHGFTEHNISARLDQLKRCVESSLLDVPELGVQVSRFPGEDDYDLPKTDIATYILDHLLPLGRRCCCLGNLITELRDPKIFLALLVIHSDRIGDEPAVVCANRALANDGYPYAEHIGAWLRRTRGGRQAGLDRRQKAAPMHDEIRRHAERLRSAGKPDREIAGILANIYGRGDRQIRRILQRKPDMT
jgi:hypothetical protein